MDQPIHTPVKLRWSGRNVLDEELSIYEEVFTDWREAAVAISQIHLYDNLELRGVSTSDMEGFRSYAAHLRPYGVLWYPEIENV